MPIVTPDWVGDAVFYQVFPDRFARSGRVDAPGPLEPWDAPPTIHGFKGGDLYGVAERLDYLEALGVTALYLNPVFASASNHRYHTYDYYTVDPLLGGNEALRTLLDAAHARGMRVVLDGVFNHSGRGFWPFHHVLECGVDSPYLDWFHVNREAMRGGLGLRAYPDRELLASMAEGERAAVLAAEPGRGRRSLEALGYRGWWDLPALPKLNTDNPHMREYLLRVAEHWIRFGIDGWRLDVAAEIDDDEFWREFRRRVRTLNPEAYIVAEIWHEDHRWVQGDQFDAYMNYPLGFAAVAFCAGEHRDERVLAQHHEVGRNTGRIDGPTFLHRLEEVLNRYDPAINGVQLNLLDSHDTPRVRSMMAGDDAGVRMATLVLMTLAGAPSIYYGDEVGLSGEHDPGCRGAFPADDRDWDTGLLAFFRGATALRHAHAVLRRGTFRPAGAAGAAAAYIRADEASAFLVAINAGEAPASLEVAPGAHDGRTFEPVTWDGWSWPAGDPVQVRGERAVVPLPPRSARILRAR